MGNGVTHNPRIRPVQSCPANRFHAGRQLSRLGLRRMMCQIVGRFFVGCVCTATDKIMSKVRVLPTAESRLNLQKHCERIRLLLEKRAQTHDQMSL